MFITEQMLLPIPFKVTVKPTPRDEDEFARKLDMNPEVMQHHFIGIEPIVLDKLWTVVGLGLSGYLCLLVRDGEVSQWWPRELCVKSEEVV